MSQQPNTPTFADKVFIFVNNILELSSNATYYNYQHIISVPFVQQQFNYYINKYHAFRNEPLLSTNELINKLDKIHWLYKLTDQQYLIHLEIDDLCMKTVACSQQNCKRLHFFSRMSICGQDPINCKNRQCARYHLWPLRFRDKVASILLANGEKNKMNYLLFESYFIESFPFLFAPNSPTIFSDKYSDILKRNIAIYNKCDEHVLWRIVQDEIIFDEAKIVSNICADDIQTEKGCYASRYVSFKTINTSTQNRMNVYKYAYHPTICSGIHCWKGFRYYLNLNVINRKLLLIGSVLHVLSPYFYHFLTSGPQYRHFTFKPFSFEEDNHIVQRLEEKFKVIFKQMKQTKFCDTLNNMVPSYDNVYDIDKVIHNGFHNGENLKIIKVNYYYNDAKSLLECIENTLKLFDKATHHFKKNLHPIDVSIRNLHKVIDLIYRIHNYNDNMLLFKSMMDEMNKKFAFGRAVAIQSKIIAEIPADDSVLILLQISNVNLMVTPSMMRGWFEYLMKQHQDFFKMNISSVNHLNMNDFQFVKAYQFWTIPQHYDEQDMKNDVYGKWIHYHVRDVEDQYIEWMNHTFKAQAHFIHAKNKHNIYSLKTSTQRFFDCIPPISGAYDINIFAQKYLINIKTKQNILKDNNYLLKYNNEGNPIKLLFKLNGTVLSYGLEKLNLSRYQILDIKFKDASYALELIPPESDTMVRFIVTPDLILTKSKQKEISDDWKQKLAKAAFGPTIKCQSIIRSKDKYHLNHSEFYDDNQEEQKNNHENKIPDNHHENVIKKQKCDCTSPYCFDNPDGQLYWLNLKHEQSAKRSPENDAQCGPGLPSYMCRYCLFATWSEEHAQKCLFIPTWVQESGAYNGY